MTANHPKQAQTQLNRVRGTLNCFNIPHDGHKAEPSDNFTYLGIEYCLKSQACRVPTAKVSKVNDLLKRFIFGNRSTEISKKEIESLQGKLIYFSRVNIFIRPLISCFITLNGRIPKNTENFSR